MAGPGRADRLLLAPGAAGRHGRGRRSRDGGAAHHLLDGDRARRHAAGGVRQPSRLPLPVLLGDLPAGCVPSGPRGPGGWQGPARDGRGASSFGQVHARRARGGTVYPCHPARLGERCPHGRGLACWHKHDEGDARLGEPICPGCYDTQTQALWNAAAPELWRRTTITLRRVLARELGLTSEAFVRRVRVAYVKVAEYQARGAVHFHGVFRLDGRDPTDPTAVLPPPDGASVDLLERAIREAAERARVLVPAFADVPTRAARWGPQLDLRVIRPTGEAVRTRRSCRPSGSPATSPNTRPRARKALALLWTGASTTARPLRPLHRTRRGRLPGRCPHRRGHHRAAATAARPSLWSAAGAVAPASQGVEMTDRTSDGGRQGKRKGRRMFGTVRKLPSGRWQARYWDDKGRRQTAPHTFLTKADAARYLALVEADLTRGLFHDPRRGAIPFGEWADRWMDNAELRPTTRDLYGYLLRRFIKPTFEAVTLAEIDDVMVEDWLAELRTRPKLSSSTIAKAYRLLARILGAAVKQRYILHTTWRIEGAGKEHAAEMRCASPEQINALADAVAPRYRALVLVAGYGGLRWGELVGPSRGPDRQNRPGGRAGDGDQRAVPPERAQERGRSPLRGAPALRGRGAQGTPCDLGRAWRGGPRLPRGRGRVDAPEQLPPPRLAARDESGRSRGPSLPRP